MGLDDLGGLLKTLEHLEHCGEVGRRRSEDVLAIVVEDEVGVEVVRYDRRVPIPRVVAVGILHVALGLMNRRLVAPSVGADLVVVKSVLCLFVILVGPSVRVGEDDEDPAMLRRQ